MLFFRGPCINSIYIKHIGLHRPNTGMPVGLREKVGKKEIARNFGVKRPKTG
jgi:hypothetical protein